MGVSVGVAEGVGVADGVAVGDGVGVTVLVGLAVAGRVAAGVVGSTGSAVLVNVGVGLVCVGEGVGLGVGALIGWLRSVITIAATNATNRIVMINPDTTRNTVEFTLGSDVVLSFCDHQREEREQDRPHEQDWRLADCRIQNSGANGFDAFNTFSVHRLLEFLASTGEKTIVSLHFLHILSIHGLIIKGNNRFGTPR